MKFKKNFRISFVISVIFLFFFTIISSFIFIISLKPVKLNFLNYFDRESRIFKKIKVEEIGDVFLSFNKVTKNFEILIEDLVYENSYFPNILIGLDLTFEKKIFDMSLKIFDGDIEIVLPKELQNDNNDFSVYSKLKNNFNFLNKFDDIQIVNTKFKLKIDENLKNYLIDFNSKNDEFYFSLTESNSLDNFLLMNLVNNQNNKEIIIEFNKFNFDFIKHFNYLKNFSFQDLYLSGSSKFLVNNDYSIDQMAFNFYLDGNLKYTTFDGHENINFNKSKIFGEKNDENFDVILDFLHLNSQFKFVFRFNPKEQRLVQILLDLDAISVKRLLKIWPKNYKSSVYTWMKANSSGKISNLLISSGISKDSYPVLKIDNLKGKFDFSETKIRYMDTMPIIENIAGEAKIKNDKITFSIISGVSNDLKIKSGNVKLFDLETDFEKADIDLEIFGGNEKIVNYLNFSPIKKKNYSKLTNIRGDTKVNLNLKFPLLLDLLAEQIEYRSNVLIENSVFTDIFNNHNLDNFNLKIKINNTKVSYEGNGELFSSLVKFNGQQSNINEQFIDEINGTYNLRPVFTESFFSESDIIQKGDVEISFIISENNDGLSKIEGIGNLDNLLIESKFLGPDLDFKKGKLRFLIRPYDNLFSGFVDVKTNNLKIEVNSLFTLKKLLELDIQNFKSPIQDFKLKYYANENKLSVVGERLTLKSINIFEENDFDDDNFELNLEVDNFIVGGMSFLDSKIKAQKIEDSFEEMFVSLIGENDFHKLKIVDSEIGKEFVLESNYIPGLLNILDLNFNINQGSLKIEGSKPKNSQKYEGAIAGKNIVFFDAPFLANFFSIFSLDGFAQKLKDGGIIFNNFNAEYKLEDKKIKIVDSLLKGSELGIQFDSVIGLDDDYFLMNGSIIPAYTINTLITKFPIVGDIVTAGSPEDGLIGAKFKVEKIDGEYEVFYNPISVFVPNIIKNFLSN